MDPLDLAADQTSPDPIPARDHMADSDVSLIRKRPRLTPPQHSGDEPDLPEPTPGSPVVELVASGSDVDLLTEIIVLDNDELEADSVASFPWVIDHRGPEQTAAQFASMCCDPSHTEISIQDIEEFAQWFHNHVANASAAYDGHSYVDNRAFWFHIGRCLEGLATRSLNSLPSKSKIDHPLGDEVLCALATLCATLCTAELDQLERATSRRDSVKPMSNSKSTLLFPSYIASFEKFMRRSDLARNKPGYDGYSSIQRRMAHTFIRSQDDKNSILRLYSLIATRPELVESAHEALYLYLRLYAQVLLATSLRAQTENEAASIEVYDSSTEEVQSFRRAMSKILELSSTHVVPDLLKIHPECLPVNIHSDFIDVLTEIVEVLAATCSPSSFMEGIEQRLHCCNDVADLIPYGDEITSPGQRVPGKLMLHSAFKSDILKDFIMSGIMALRVLGIDLLSSYLLRVWKRYSPDDKAQDLHPLLQFIAQYLRSNDFIRYLFGSNSHADLIRRSARLLEFLSVTHNLTQTDADIIWGTCLQNQHTDFGQASLQVLSTLVRNADYQEKLNFCAKFNKLPASELGRPMIILFKDVITNLPCKVPHAKACLEIACIAIGVLKKTSINGKDLEIQHIRETVMGGIAELLAVFEDNNYTRCVLLELCAEDIKNCTPYATGGVHAFLDLSNGWPLKSSTARLTEILSFKDVHGELCLFVDYQRDRHHGKECFMHALYSRIRLANLLLSLDCEYHDTQTEREFWEHTIGAKAIDDDARDIAWHALILDLKGHATFSSYFERCITLYLPNLPTKFATNGLLIALRYFMDRALTSQRLESEIMDEIIRFALASPDDAVAESLMDIVMETVFYDQAVDYPKTNSRQQLGVIERCMKCVFEENEEQVFRAVKLLRKILQRSLDRYTSARLPRNDPLHGIEPRELSPDTIRLPVQVFGTSDRPEIHNITLQGQKALSDLHYTLEILAGSSNFITICGGQPLDLMTDPTRELRNSGIAGKALILKVQHTLQSIRNDKSKKNGRTLLERAILEHFEGLYVYLDRATTASEELFWLLTELQPSMTWTTLPHGESTWKVTYSVHRLSIELHEQLSLGVADAEFMMRGVHALISALERYGGTKEWLLLRFIARTLFEFLRGRTTFAKLESSNLRFAMTDKPPERPEQHASNQYFEAPASFVRSALVALQNLTQAAEEAKVPRSGDLAETTIDIYRSVLESVRLNSAVCAALLDMTDFKLLHVELLFSHDQSLSSSIADSMRSFCMDADAPGGVKSFFWQAFVSSLPKAQETPEQCASFYKVAPDIIAVNADVLYSEAKLRHLIDEFSTMMLQTSHQEDFRTDTVDYRIPGLCNLLLACVNRLKSFKKDLNLGNIALDIYQKFLFPLPGNVLDRRSRHVPIITSQTRRAIYSLIHTLCEDMQTFEALAKSTLQAMSLCNIQWDQAFLGRDSFSRTGCGYSGLLNLQQTCYMNSLIQQLYMNLHFRRFILDTPVICQNRQAVLQEFKRTFAYMQEHYGSAYCPDRLAKALDVDITVQDDAQIFFTILIGKLEDSMADEGARTTLKSFFKGLNKSQTVGECGHISESPDEYYNLSLVVKDKSSLEESLQEYIQGAPLEGGDRFKCMSCDPKGEGVYVNAVRRTGLEQVPDNLVLGLKRFQYETYDGGAKVNDRFDFPKRIDMNAYKIQHLADPDRHMDPDIFQLVGVVVHDGTLQYGHYWSYAAERSISDGNAMPWYRLEDRLTSSVTIEEVVAETRGGVVKQDRDGIAWLRSDSAYVLFYERLSSIESATRLTNAPSPTLAPEPAVTSYPRMPVPEDLELEIATENEKHLRTLNMYSAEHAEFVSCLLLKFEDVSKGQPSQDSAAESLILELAFEHLFRVTTRTQSLDHLDRIMSSLRRQASLKAENAIQFFDLLFEQPNLGAYERFIFHKRPPVRSHTRRLLVSSLRILRSEDPERYGADADGNLAADPRTCIRRVTIAHTELLSRLYSTRLVWPEYFGFVTDVAALGPHETALLIERGYLTWCLEVLSINKEPEMQRKHQDIWYHIQHSRMYPFHTLASCIHGLLQEHVDLTELTNSSAHSSKTEISDEIVVLSDNDSQWISNTDLHGRNVLVLATISAMMDSDSCISVAPAKLIALLSDQHRIDRVILKAVHLALVKGLQSDGFPVYLEVIAHCIVNGDMDQDYKHALMEAVMDLPVNFEDAVENVLQFLNIVQPAEPIAVIDAVAKWAHKLLVCDDADSEDSILDWLRNNFFVHSTSVNETPSENKRLEYQRALAIKRLASILLGIVHGAHNRLAEYEDYERAVGALGACACWLREFTQDAKYRSSQRIVSVGDKDDDITMKTSPVSSPETSVCEEDMEEAVVDANEISEQCEVLLGSLGEWSQGELSDLAYRNRDRDAKAGSARSSEMIDVDTDVESGSEEWISEGGETDLP